MNAHPLVNAKHRDTVVKKHAQHPSFQKPTPQPPAHALVQLQRSIGNQAVNRVIQANFRVNSSGDEYGRQAEDAAVALKQIVSKPNNTGLPDNLKTGIETLSGISMDNVKVHYDSAQPALFSALAYAQASDIYVGPGQEEHLPHEAWHVVQQAKGGVQPTLQIRGGVSVNDDAGLEREADVMGEWANASGQYISKQKARPDTIAPQPLTMVPRAVGRPAREAATFPVCVTPPSPSGVVQLFGGKKDDRSNDKRKNVKNSKGVSKKSIPKTKAALEKQVSGVARIPGGREMVLSPYKEGQIPLDYEGTQEDWDLCCQWAKELGENTPAPPATGSAAARPTLKELKEQASIDHNKVTGLASDVRVLKNNVNHAEQGQTAFVANLITTPVDDFEKLVARYSTLYVPATTGFAMVVGVNLFRALDQSHVRRLADIKIPKADFPLTVLVFAWDMPWTKPYDEVLKIYADFVKRGGSADEVKAYEKSFVTGSIKAVPYGLLRSTVLQHKATQQYVADLSQSFTQVYIFNTDADAPSFETQAQKDDPTAPPLLEGYAKEIAKITGRGSPPELLVGGYRFDYRSQEGGKGGDLDPTVSAHRLTYLANQLDSTFRALLSEVNAELIYPTEPNMAFLAASNKNSERYTKLTTLTESHGAKGKIPPWGWGAREGVRLREHLRAAGAPELRTVYLPHLATPTDSTRFRIPAALRPAECPSFEEFCAERIGAMVKEEQTYITKLAVMLEGSSLEKGGNFKINPKWINERIMEPLIKNITKPTSLPKSAPAPKKVTKQKEVVETLESGNFIPYFLEKCEEIVKGIHGELRSQHEALFGGSGTGAAATEQRGMEDVNLGGTAKEGEMESAAHEYVNYSQQIERIRQTIAHPAKGGTEFPDYPITSEQREFLIDKKLVLTRTFPDGDCSINAVLQSLGLEKHPLYVRAEAFKSRKSDKSILDPGNWESSPQLLDWLSSTYEVTIKTVGPKGQVVEERNSIEPKQEIFLLWVEHAGGGALAHYYGTRKSGA